MIRSQLTQVHNSLRALIAVRRENPCSGMRDREGYPGENEFLPPKSAIRSKNKVVFDALRHDTARWISHWPAESFTQCSPLICACLIGPALSYVDESTETSGMVDDVERQTIILALKRLARHWTISKVLLGEEDFSRALPFLSCSTDYVRYIDKLPDPRHARSDREWRIQFDDRNKDGTTSIQTALAKLLGLVKSI